ncbi:MAG: hypothetical protein ABID54_08755 [Pseudomonadota bacterium]
MAVIDVSPSMATQPEVAHDEELVDKRTSYEKSRDIFGSLVSQNPDIDFSPLLYSTESYVARYFAYKPELLRDTIENQKEVEYLAIGTETATALAKARKFLTDNVEGDKAIVLISDLREPKGRTADEIVTDLSAGIKVYAIVVGEALPIDELRSLFPGVEIVGMDDKFGIDRICAELSQIQSSPIMERTVLLKRSLIPFLILPALGLITLGLILSETRFRKIP